MNKTSLSVREMGRILGLGKTDSYWLVHKKVFKTQMVAGKMRVMVDSFERWYANQLHYKKVNGEAPGAELLSRTMTVQTMAQLLQISKDSAYDLLHSIHFQTVKTEYSGQRLLIEKKSFYEWLNSQSYYKAVEEKEDDDD